MDIMLLEPGEKAPTDADRIIIEKLPSGKFQFSGVARTGATWSNFVHHGAYDTSEEAKDAGVLWAAGLDLKFVNVEFPDA